MPERLLSHPIRLALGHVVDPTELDLGPDR
jgi:hypothetical protein